MIWGTHYFRTPPQKNKPPNPQGFAGFPHLSSFQFNLLSGWRGDINTVALSSDAILRETMENDAAGREPKGISENKGTRKSSKSWD